MRHCPLLRQGKVYRMAKSHLCLLMFSFTTTSFLGIFLGVPGSGSSCIFSYNAILHSCFLRICTLFVRITPLSDFPGHRMGARWKISCHFLRRGNNNDTYECLARSILFSIGYSILRKKSVGVNKFYN